MIDNVFILAGGAGTRLWPASNSKTPKQFLPVNGEKSLLMLTLERALGLGPDVNVYIITLKDQMENIIAECALLENGRERVHVLPEPAPRNTAPAIAACSGFLQTEGRGGEITLVLPADHLIEPFESFRDDVEKASLLAAEGFLVTFGIKPSYPSTGYGYIEAGVKEYPGFRVKNFKEKPDREAAEAFLEKGGFYWNSGMFVFRLDRYMEELEKSSPGIASVFSGIGKGSLPVENNGLKIILDTEEVRSRYSNSPKDSIDYAVMEHCSRVAVVEASFDWNDIGSWDEMAGLEDNSPNALRNNVFSVESSGNFILSDIPVAVCGVDDLIIVQKNGALLVCRKGEAQLVKDAVELIRENGPEAIL